MEKIPTCLAILPKRLLLGCKEVPQNTLQSMYLLLYSLLSLIDDERYVKANAGCKHFDVHGGPENIPVSRFDFDAKVIYMHVMKIQYDNK